MIGANLSVKKASVPLASRFGFAFGDLSFNLVWQGTALFLMYYYTDILGIPVVAAGAIYLAAMFWDAITDPLIAIFADRTRTRWGKYRPWLLFGAPAFAISYPLAYSGPGALPVDPVIWALVTHLFLRTAYTIVAVPFTSLQARLTHDAQERAVVAGFRMVGAASGGLMVVLLTPFFVSWYGEGREAHAYFVAACIASGIALATLWYSFFCMREPASDYGDPLEPIWSDLKGIGSVFLRNPPLMRVFGIVISGSLCLGMFGKNVVYHFKYDIQRPDLTMIGLLIPAILLILTVPIWVALAKRTSKRTALAIGAMIGLAGYLWFFFNSAGNLTYTFAAMGLAGIGSSAFAVMFWSMLPDTVEYGQAVTGVRAESKTFGFATFAQKAAVGINALLLGALLEWVGYIPNEPQSAETLLGMKAIMALVPAAGVIVILILLSGYKVDDAQHAQLLKDIESHPSKG